MTTFRTAAADPAQDRPGAPGRESGRKPPRRALPEPALADSLPATEPSDDALTARVQARLEAIEASPEALEPRRRSARLPVPEVDDADVIADLNRQLDVLRDQLEVAFDDSDRRIADAQAAADAAQARVTEVVAAVEELMTELNGLEPSRPADLDALRAGIARFRELLRPH